MVERRPPQAPPASSSREDTVAIPVKRSAPSNGTGAGAGSGKVLPPMPKDAPAGRSATPPPPPPPPPAARKQAAAKQAAKPAAKQAPKSPPKSAPRSAPKSAAPAPAQAAAPAPATTEPVAKQRPAVTPMPVVPEVDKRAERQAARDAKAAEKNAAKQAAKTKAAEPKAAPRPSRRARLRMTRVDPWSVMKTAFLLSIALGIVIVVSVFMVWSVLDAADVWSSINQTVRDVLGGESATTFDIEDYLGTRRVVGFAMIVAAVDVVLLTAIATLGAFLYNMSASLLGGIEVTLAEDK